MPPEIDHGQVLTILGILAFFVLAYSLVIAQQVLLGIFVVLALGLVYLFFVFIQILDRIATSLEALAEEKRRE